MKQFRTVIMLFMAAMFAASASASYAASADESNWTLEGPLGKTPAHTHADLPLSDQGNRGKWVLDTQFTDEFDGPSLDLTRWHIFPTSPDDWEGRQPALYVPSNVSVSGGELNIEYRKAEVPLKYVPQGYKDYTSACVKTIRRTGYGYYEIKAKAMKSAASSAFWFTDTGLKGNSTELDVFEIGANSPEFRHKYNMTAHVWETPAEKRHWAVGAFWESPWNMADDYHVYGFAWNEKTIVWYVDGVPVHRLLNTNWYYPMQLLFDSEAMLSWFGPINDSDLPSVFSIQYLRVWRHRSVKHATDASAGIGRNK